MYNMGKLIFPKSTAKPLNVDFVVGFGVEYVVSDHGNVLEIFCQE